MGMKGLGAIIERSGVHCYPETAARGSHYGIDPLGMRSSGALLVAVAPDEAERVLCLFLEQGYGAASIMGTMEDGTPKITVVP